MLFIQEFPALLDEDRMPINYKIFKSGVTVIMRTSALKQLMMSRSVRAGQSDAEGFEKWLEEKIAHAGLPLSPREEEEQSEGEVWG